VNFETVKAIAEKPMAEQRGFCVEGNRKGPRNSVHRNACRQSIKQKRSKNAFTVTNIDVEQ
jgi:hypothetical protein